MANVDAPDSDSPISSALSMEDHPTPEPDSVVSTLRALSESPDLTDPALEARLYHAKLSAYIPRDRKDQTVRILQSFIDHLPPGGKRIVVKFVVSNGDDKLHELATHLKTAVLIPFRARGGKTPQVTESPFSDTDINRDDVASEMTESSSRKDQQPLKWLCLKRDGYRCVVTGIWDDHAEQRCPPGQRGTHIGETELAHIIPFSMGKWEDADEEKAIAQSWETIYLLFPDVYSVLKPSDVNSAENALTLLSPLHRNFGNLKIAFIPTDRENTYKIKTHSRFSSYLFQQMPPPNEDGDRLVTFNQHANYELPSRVLLATHAAIAEILHASGQGEQIEELLHDWDAIRCLASDGSTDLQSLLSLVHVH
ncbi:hypothetical protein Aspvir_001188 [Aspergillus viridinutans]|uniref:HNH nuclease domain-containing protein n=1 Tax=Aspergillus viridinutans TaxID=75553 RepID=A0A9P3F1Y7_ASPVI|nr:uncharacterized protein Aspvir_001188 [Aspergillus viridinutans]GIJ99064.1 hypothetical protein Aspvir_001188 [Aspergillus viridinutans]